MSNSQTTVLKNDTRFEDMMSDVRKLANEAKNGADALPRLAVRITAASFDGVIDETASHKNAEGNAVDAATYVYEKYAATEGKKQFSEYTKNGNKANVSKLRQFVKLGQHGQCEGPKVLARAVEIRDEAAAAGEKVLSPYPALLGVARRQVELDREITDGEMREAVIKSTPDAKTATDYVRRSRDVLEKVITGENRDGVQCQDEAVIAAFEKLDGFLQMAANKARIEKLLAEAAELGITLPGGDDDDDDDDDAAA